MATAMMFQAVSGFKLDPVQMALLGQKAENQFVGVNSGILDQYSSAMGQAGKTILLDCRALTSELVGISPDLQVVICDTKTKRNLLGSEYDDRRKQCEQGVAILQTADPAIASLRDVPVDLFNRMKDQMPPLVQKRCQFILEENQRVLDLAQPLAQNDGEKLKAIFAASYTGARDLFEIGAPTMQAMIQVHVQRPRGGRLPPGRRRLWRLHGLPGRSRASGAILRLRHRRIQNPHRPGRRDLRRPSLRRRVHDASLSQRSSHPLVRTGLRQRVQTPRPDSL